MTRLPSVHTGRPAVKALSPSYVVQPAIRGAWNSVASTARSYCWQDGLCESGRASNCPMSVAPDTGGPNRGHMLEPLNSLRLPTRENRTSVLVLLGESGRQAPTGCARNAVGRWRGPTPTPRGLQGDLRPSPLLVFPPAPTWLRSWNGTGDSVAARRPWRWLAGTGLCDSAPPLFPPAGLRECRSAARAGRGSWRLWTPSRAAGSVSWQLLGRCQHPSLALQPWATEGQLPRGSHEGALAHPLIGYQRLEIPSPAEGMDSIYREFWYPRNNRVQPLLRLVYTEAVGNRTRQRYHRPTAPLRQPRDSGPVKHDKARELIALYTATSPLSSKGAALLEGRTR